MFPELLLVRKICIEDTGIADGGFKVRRSWVWDSLVAQTVKNLPAVWETWVRSLGWEDSPEEEKGYPLQYSGLENSMDCIVHGVSPCQNTGVGSLSLLQGSSQSRDQTQVSHTAGRFFTS